MRENEELLSVPSIFQTIVSNFSFTFEIPGS